MVINSRITYVQIIICLLISTSACFAEETTSDNFNIVDFKPPVQQTSVIKTDSKITDFKSDFNNSKLEGVIQNLDNLRSESQNNYNEIKNQLDESKNQYKESKRKFKLIKKELKTLDAAKKQIQKNIQIREKLYNPLNPLIKL